MTFSSEDKRVWLESEVMQELEKIAIESNILNQNSIGAFDPIEDEPVQDDSWEDENDEGVKLPEEENYSKKIIEQVKNGLVALKDNFSSKNQINEVHLFDRTLESINEIDTEDNNSIKEVINNLILLSKKMFLNGNKEVSKVIIDLAKKTLNKQLEKTLQEEGNV